MVCKILSPWSDERAGTPKSVAQIAVAHFSILQSPSVSLLTTYLPNLTAPQQVLSGHMSTRSCKPFAGTTIIASRCTSAGIQLLGSSALAPTTGFLVREAFPGIRPQGPPSVTPQRVAYQRVGVPLGFQDCSRRPWQSGGRQATADQGTPRHRNSGCHQPSACLPP